MNEATKTAKRWKEIVEEGAEVEELARLPYWAQWEGREVWGIYTHGAGG